MGVAVIGILVEDQPQVPFAGDQHPVRAFAVGTAELASGLPASPRDRKWVR
jgi:hypothetical protein